MLLERPLLKRASPRPFWGWAPKMMFIRPSELSRAFSSVGHPWAPSLLSWQLRRRALQSSSGWVSPKAGSKVPIALKPWLSSRSTFEARHHAPPASPCTCSTSFRYMSLQRLQSRTYPAHILGYPCGNARKGYRRSSWKIWWLRLSLLAFYGRVVGLGDVV